MTKLRRFAFSAVALLALILTGSPVTSALARDHLVVAMARGAPASTTLVGLAIGAFEKEGIDVQVVEMPSASEISVALAGGDVQIGLTALSAAFFNIAGKDALRVIGGTSRLEPGYEGLAYLVSNKAYDSGVHQPRDLAGKSIAITTQGSPLHYATILLAHKYNFDPASMHLVLMRGMGPAASAVQTNHADATIVSPALAHKVAAAGEGHIIGWVDKETPFQMGGILVTRKMIETQRPLLERFVRAYLAASAAYGDAFLRLDASGKPIRGANYDRFVDEFVKRRGVDRKLVEGSIPFWDPKARLDVGSVYAQVKAWQELGLVDKTVSPQEVIDLSFIPDQLNVPKK